MSISASLPLSLSFFHFFSSSVCKLHWTCSIGSRRRGSASQSHSPRLYLFGIYCVYCLSLYARHIITIIIIIMVCITAKGRLKSALEWHTTKISFFFFSHSFSDVPRFVSHVLCCLVCSVIFLLKSLLLLAVPLLLPCRNSSKIYINCYCLHATEAGSEKI